MSTPPSSSSAPEPEAGRADPADEAAFRRYSDELAEAVPPALHRWVQRSVRRIAVEAGTTPDESLERAAADAANLCADEVGRRVADLLARDLDEQRSTPLSLLRSATRYPTEVLRRAGVPTPERDSFDAAAFPEDLYGLTPASFADLDDSLHEPGLRWGAAKAHVHLARRRAEGRL